MSGTVNSNNYRHMITAIRI